MRRFRTRPFLILLAVALLGAIGWRLAHVRRNRRRANDESKTPQPVAVQPVVRGDLEIYLEGLGTVTPISTVTVRTQISGQLVRVDFQEGQMVHQGDILAVIDPRPYQVALEQSEGQLRQAQAQLKEAKIDLARYETLAKQQSIAQQQVDSQRALVEQDEGVVQTDQAAVDSARLNLVYCHVSAPITGRVGLRVVDQGNYVTPGDSGGLVVLTRVRPITAIFTLPEQYLPQVLGQLHRGAIVPVDAYDQADTHRLASGKLEAIDNQADPTTGTFRLRATFPNDDEALYPQEFVNVRMLLRTERQVLIIPTSGVERNQQGSFVYVVKPNRTVATRPVKLGPVQGERVEVTSGLSAGEEVVVDGADKLRDGMQVSVQPDGPRP